MSPSRSFTSPIRLSLGVGRLRLGCLLDVGTPANHIIIRVSRSHAAYPRRDASRSRPIRFPGRRVGRHRCGEVGGWKSLESTKLAATINSPAPATDRRLPAQDPPNAIKNATADATQLHTESSEGTAQLR